MAALVTVVTETAGVSEAVAHAVAGAELLVDVPSIGLALTGVPEAAQSIPSSRVGRGAVINGQASERGVAGVLARFRSPDGTLLEAANVVRAEFTVVDGDGLQVDSGVLDLVECFAARFLSTSGWRGDRIGWNLRHVYDGQAFRKGGTEYRVEYAIEDVEGMRYGLVHRVLVRPGAGRSI